MEALERRDQSRMAEVNTVQAPNPNARNKKTTPRQGSPVFSNASKGSSASRSSSTGRTVRFQDQEDARPGNQAYGSSSRSRWQGIRPSRGHNDGSRLWSDRRQQGQATPRSQSPSGSGWMQRQGGPRFPPPHPGGSWTTGQGGPRFRPPGFGQYRQLEARMAVVIRRSQWTTASPTAVFLWTTTLEPGLS